MTQRNPIAPGRRIIAAGAIRHTTDRVTTVRITEAGVTGSSMRRERVAELHRLAADDYAKGKSQRAAVGAYTAFAPAVEPSDLTVAVDIAQQMLGSSDVLAVREALRLVLRALGAETNTAKGADTAGRCPAAQLDDSPCSGPLAVTIYAEGGAGSDGCEHHAAQLLAAADGLHPVSLPDADGAAHRVFRAAASLRYFAAHRKAEPPKADSPSRGCGAPATVRIEGYSTANGSVWGSLDLAVYACQEHAPEARTGWLDGRRPYSSPSSGNACGYVFDYSKPGGGQ